MGGGPPLEALFATGSISSLVQTLSKDVQIPAAFIHYTSATAFSSIIQNKSLWLRNARLMNDTKEINQGYFLIAEFLEGKGASALDCLGMFSLSQDLGQLTSDAFREMKEKISRNQYIFSFAEHHQQRFPDGKLSMWRSYGAETPIALVLDPYFLTLDSRHQSVFSFPIHYDVGENVDKLLDTLLDRAWDLLQEESGTYMIRNDYEVAVKLAQVLEIFCLSIKHAAFQEEEEWRFVYRPGWISDSTLPKQSVVLNGDLQSVHTLGIEEADKEDGEGLHINRLVREVIIGPSKFPQEARSAVIDILSALPNFNNPEERVRIADMPLRV
jgi:hypothetical protein